MSSQRHLHRHGQRQQHPGGRLREQHADGQRLRQQHRHRRPGISTINGGTGYNLLIGGYTAYDAVFADLESILSIWKTVNSATKYAQAISKLTASSYAYSLSAATVHGNANDTINAGTHALDWYFVALASEITGEKTGETVTLC